MNLNLKKVENMFRLMDEIFIKSLQSVQKIIINDKHCFELYGYDILLDANLKPYINRITNLFMTVHKLCQILLN